MHQILFFALQNSAQLNNAPQCGKTQRIALVHHVLLPIAIGNLLFPRTGHMNRLTALLQHMDQGHVKLENVFLRHVRHNQNLFHNANFTAFSKHPCL